MWGGRLISHQKLVLQRDLVRVLLSRQQEGTTDERSTGQRAGAAALGAPADEQPGASRCGAASGRLAHVPRRVRAAVPARGAAALGAAVSAGATARSGAEVDRAHGAG